MSNRFIGENTRLIYDIIHYANSSQIVLRIVFVNGSKSNTNVSAAILQYGTLSEFFNIECGCRQDDPISAYLFILCAQIMFLLIVNDKNLKGISVNGNEFKISQFADDTTLILDGSRSTLLAALNVLEVFGNMSGLKVNMDKTKLVWIGKKRHSKDKLDVGC